MDNKSSNQENQEEALRFLLDEVQQGEKEEKNQVAAIDETEVQKREVDVLNLPPRKEVHSKNKQRTHIKMSKPLLRFLFVFILLLGVLIGVYFVWGELINGISNL